MSRTERVILTFRPFCKAGQAPRGSQSSKIITSTGHYLVNVALVTDVPDNFVSRRIKNTVKCKCQFDYAEI